MQARHPNVALHALHALHLLPQIPHRAVDLTVPYAPCVIHTMHKSQCNGVNRASPIPLSRHCRGPLVRTAGRGGLHSLEPWNRVQVQARAGIHSTRAGALSKCTAQTPGLGPAQSCHPTRFRRRIRTSDADARTQTRVTTRDACKRDSRGRSVHPLVRVAAAGSRSSIADPSEALRSS